MSLSLASLALPTLAITAAVAQPVYAEPDPAPPPSAASQTTLELAGDLASFAALGWSIEAYVRPAATPHWRFGGLVVSVGLPGSLVKAIGNDNWGAHATGSMAIVDYFLSTRRSGGFVGAAMGVWDWGLTSPSKMHLDAWYLEPEARLGYHYAIPRTPLFLQPWAGLAVPIKVGGQTTSNGTTFDQLPVIPFAAFDFGATW
jgi:hypothetical protein